MTLKVERKGLWEEEEGKRQSLISGLNSICMYTQVYHRKAGRTFRRIKRTSQEEGRRMREVGGGPNKNKVQCCM